MTERVSWRFVAIAAFFVTTLVVSNVIAVKLVEIEGRIFPAGLVIFPLAYVLGDVLTEVYGYRAARQVIWLGFACNLLAVGAIQIAIQLPAAGFYVLDEAYADVLGTTWRLFLASLAAYLVGELANSVVLARMKVATGGRFLWARTIGSTIVGEGLDSAIFVTLAFAGHGRAAPRPDPDDVGDQGRLGDGRDAVHLRDREPPQAGRGRRRLRPRHALQPAARSAAEDQASSARSLSRRCQRSSVSRRPSAHHWSRCSRPYGLSASQSCILEPHPDDPFRVGLDVSAARRCTAPAARATTGAQPEASRP